MNEDVPLSSEGENRRPRPVVLLLLDGWGIASANEANAITAAKTPVFLKIVQEYPVAALNPGKLSLNERYLVLGSGQNEITEDTPGLSAVISKAGLKQLKLAETERFAALTTMFNGRQEDRFSGEDWKIISSAENNHSVKPFLVFKRSVKALLEAINKEDDSYAFIAASLPYLDLTASTGDFSAAKKAVADIDKSLKAILAAVLEKKGLLIISSAAGNAEKMRDFSTDMIDNSITVNPVPFIICSEDYKGKTIGLSDPMNNDLSLLAPAGNFSALAPSILKILGIEQPESMKGKSLI
jgi:2,3-bisphosphoglycerate-independent phosphoglycerate mutase